MTSLEQLAEKMKKAKSKPKKHPFPIMGLILRRDRTRLIDLYLERSSPEPRKEFTEQESQLMEQDKQRIEIEKERIKIDKQMLKMAKPKKEPDRPNPFLI